MAIPFMEVTESTQPHLGRAIRCLPGQRWVLNGGGGGTKTQDQGGKVQNESKISREWIVPPLLCPFCRSEKWDSEKLNGV